MSNSLDIILVFLYFNVYLCVIKISRYYYNYYFSFILLKLRRQLKLKL